MIQAYRHEVVGPGVARQSYNGWYRNTTMHTSSRTLLWSNEGSGSMLYDVTNDIRNIPPSIILLPTNGGSVVACLCIHWIQTCTILWVHRITCIYCNEYNVVLLCSSSPRRPWYCTAYVQKVISEHSKIHPSTLPPLFAAPQGSAARRKTILE